MNKKTIAVDSETYQAIITTIKSGFEHRGVNFQPNVRIATVLILEYNLGLRVGDILHLKMDSFVRDGERYLIGTNLSKIAIRNAQSILQILIAPFVRG